MYDLIEHILRGHSSQVWDILENDLPFVESDESGWTPMHAAALYDEYLIGEMLKKRGQTVASFNDFGATAIHVAAAFAGNINFLGANNEPSSLCIRSNDENGSTPLHSAATFGNIKAIKFLIKAGVHPDIRDNHGFTALHYAVGYRDQPRVIRELVELGVPADDSDNADEVGPIYEAISVGFWGSVKTLVDMGVYFGHIDDKWLKYINTTNATGWSSLFPHTRPPLKLDHVTGFGSTL